jgi:hypothetical protein
MRGWGVLCHSYKRGRLGSAIGVMERFVLEGGGGCLSLRTIGSEETNTGRRPLDTPS